MAWQVAYREEDKKYRLWSTISDNWITDWGSKQEIQQVIAEDCLRRYQAEVVKMFLQFPHLWWSTDSSTLIQDDEADERYIAWLETSCDAGNKYYEVLEKKFQEVMRELGGG